MMVRRSVTFAMLLTAAIVAAGATGAAAQGFPNKPIKLILPYSPGGVVDYVGRQIAQYLGDAIGQPVVAENRPGAGGINGTDATARAAADGYTLLLMDPAIVINPSLQASVPYDLFKDLKVVSVVSSSPLVLVTAPQIAVKTLPELIAWGKANPGKLNFASAGIGTTPHLSGEFLQQRAGITATHVPYRSSGQSYPDIMSNKIQFAFLSIAGALPFTADNRVQAVATTGAKRSPVYPDLPTVDEAGEKGFIVDLWLGVFAPAATPDDTVRKLNTELQAILKKPDMIKALAKVGVEPNGTSAADGAAFVKTEFDKWKKVIADGNIKPE